MSLTKSILPWRPIEVVFNRKKLAALHKSSQLCWKFSNLQPKNLWTFGLALPCTKKELYEQQKVMQNSHCITIPARKLASLELALKLGLNFCPGDAKARAPMSWNGDPVSMLWESIGTEIKAVIFPCTKGPQLRKSFEERRNSKDGVWSTFVSMKNFVALSNIVP